MECPYCHGELGGWTPLDVTSGAMTRIDLIFEREV